MSQISTRMTESLLNSNTMIDLRDAFNSVFINPYLFNEKLYEIFAQTYSDCVKTILQNNLSGAIFISHTL
jgi:hypothetical protein